MRRESILASEKARSWEMNFHLEETARKAVSLGLRGVKCKKTGKVGRALKTKGSIFVSGGNWEPLGFVE